MAGSIVWYKTVALFDFFVSDKNCWSVDLGYLNSFLRYVANRWGD